MKQSLLLYLFILALIFNIFTYAYYSKQVDFQTTQIEKLTEKFESKDDEDFVDNFDEDGEPIDGESDDEFEDEENNMKKFSKEEIINNINIKMDFTPITIIMIRWTQLPVVSSSSHSLTNSNSSQGLEV